MTKARVRRDDADLIRLYLNDIAKHPLLSRADEVRLAQQIEEGNVARVTLQDDSGVTAVTRRQLGRLDRDGTDAHTTLVESNLRLVVSIAKRYQASGLPLLDLIQEGNLGLMHSVDKFDWRKGFKFSTYATWWIRQAVTRGIANSARMIRLPVGARDRLTVVQAARARLEMKLGRPATVSEIATHLDMSEDRIAEVMCFPAEPLALSAPLRAEADSELIDIVEDRTVESPYESAARAAMPAAIAKLLAQLDDREREILSLRFGLDRGEPRTLQEVGDSFDLTRERIRQIEERALSKLRQRVDNEAHDLLTV